MFCESLHVNCQGFVFPAPADELVKKFNCCKVRSIVGSLQKPPRLEPGRRQASDIDDRQDAIY